MKKFLKKRTLCLAGVALLLTGSLTVGRAMAYFTTYATATGGARVDLGFTTTKPNEEVYDWTKHIVIDNVGEHECYVRVKVLAGDKYKDGLQISGTNWSLGEDGYYYYKNVVPAGGSTPDTDELQIKIDNMDSTEDFNVVVIQEWTSVLYDENGNPYADWNTVLNPVVDTYQ